MEDRELLELAAKAASYSVDCAFSDSPLIFGEDAGPDGPREWNPLEDDGDALRLAMKLGICIQFIPECDTACAYQERPTTGEPFNVHVAGLGDIETRRVITQAAAEIGKAMQEQH